MAVGGEGVGHIMPRFGVAVLNWQACERRGRGSEK